MDTSNWKPYRYSELFDIKKGSRLTKADMLPGRIPYIGATDSNNGITALISNDSNIHPGNTISVTYNGSVAEAFYQEFEFWATDDVNVLYPKFNLNRNIAIFLCVLIHKEKFRYNYGRKWNKEVMEKSVIYLPSLPNGIPDWRSIDNYMQSLLLKAPINIAMAYEQRVCDRALSNNKIRLSPAEWKWFRFDDIFIIKKGFYNKKPDPVPNGRIPFIGATDSNNGITSMCDLDTIKTSTKTGNGSNSPLSEKIFKPNCITVSNNGSIGYAFYQDKPFTCSHDVNPLYLKDYPLNKYIALFLCTVIEVERYRWAYGRKWRPARMPGSKIKLPVTADGKPDWRMMENYIKSLSYSKLL